MNPSILLTTSSTRNSTTRSKKRKKYKCRVYRRSTHQQ